VIEADMALEVAQATGTAYAREGVDPACLNQPNEALIVARQTASAALFEADRDRNGDEQVLRQAEAELAIVLAEYEGKLAQLEADWQAAQRSLRLVLPCWD